MTENLARWGMCADYVPPPIPSRRADGGPQLLDVRQAARALACSQALVRRLVAAGELPSVRVGGAVRVSVDALHEYVERQSTGAAPVSITHARPGPRTDGGRPYQRHHFA